ncbi:hypothetical protein PINS_up006114 [Pythium insidiosum]|nr:hypothetical protein PINS_up006114 [Pythium insidiosum]
MTASQKPPAIVRGRSSLHGVAFVEDEIEDAIDPNARALKWWHHVLLLCVMYEMFLIPYFMSFRSDTSLMLVPETKVTILMELLFLADFAVQAHTGYYEDGNLIRDKRRTRRRYFTSIDFLRDVVTIIPLSLLVQGVTPRAALEMHKVLRCLKLRQYMRDIDDLHAKHFVLIKFLRLLLATMFVSHCLACVRHQFGYKGQSDNHWLPHEPSGPHSVSEEYLTALFWAFGLLSGLFEAELPHSITQFLFTMCVAICGFFMFTSHCAIFFMISRCESGTSEPAEAKIKQLRHMLQFHHVPEHLQRHAIDYLSVRCISAVSC